MDIESLRAFSKSLPAVTEDVKWGADLCFSVGGKMFCVSSLDEAAFSVSFKVTDEAFDELSTSPEIIPAPYLARYKWVLVQNWSRFSDEVWEQRVQQSYELIKAKLPKKVLKELVQV